jgi:hypothetical protein
LTGGDDWQAISESVSPGLTSAARGKIAVDAEDVRESGEAHPQLAVAFLLQQRKSASWYAGPVQLVGLVQGSEPTCVAMNGP